MRRAILVLLAGPLGACAVGPNFNSPTAPSTAGYAPAGALPTVTAAAPLAGGEAQTLVAGLDIPGQWWTLYQSAPLNDLINRALSQNPTLKSAQAALRQAQENAFAARGSLFPSASGSLGVARQKTSNAAFGLPGGGSSIYTLDSGSVNVSYTVDLFGGVRRQIEALNAQAEYERFALEAAYLSLTANVVIGVVNEASLREQLSATEQIAAAQEKQLQIVQKRLSAGGASRADVLQQQAALQGTLATLPGLRNQLAQARNLLSAYAGELPADFTVVPFSLDSLSLPAQLPVSLPSRLVEQRPDVREYAALLHEATAQIGVVTANLLPQVTLSGSIGAQAGRFADLFKPGSGVWSLGAALAQPLFKGGTLVHQRRAAVAAAEEAEANYRATVITAFENVSDALYALDADAQTLQAQQTAASSARDSLNLVQVQYQSGAASYLQVLSAEQTYQNAAIALVRARAQRFADTAALFQALGGGWWNRPTIARQM
jgi:NodT family efflux transporter outer membrane factor (OMF) lipoprotein